MRKLILDFGSFRCPAELNGSAVAARIYDRLPVTVRLTAWGQELYGPLGADLGSEAPVSQVPPGVIAYTDRGGYLCIFFGQAPAWPVDLIGTIKDGEWQRLLDVPAPDRVTITRVCDREAP